MLLSKTT